MCEATLQSYEKCSEDCFESDQQHSEAFDLNDNVHNAPELWLTITDLTGVSTLPMAKSDSKLMSNDGILIRYLEMTKDTTIHNITCIVHLYITTHGIPKKIKTPTDIPTRNSIPKR